MFGKRNNVEPFGECVLLMAHEVILMGIESCLFKLFPVPRKFIRKKNCFQLTLLLSPRSYLRENARL